MKRCSMIVQLVTVILVTALLHTTSDAQSTNYRREGFQEKRRTILLNLRHELKELSRQCHETGLAQAARDITQLSVELTTASPDWQPPRMAQLPVSDTLSSEQRTWRNRLANLRQDRGQELYVLARRCLHAGFPSLAYEMLTDVLRLNPDHKYARAVLGQQLFVDPARRDDPSYAGEWLTDFELRKRSGSRPETDHPRYGWIPVEFVERFDQGLRPWRGKWVSVEKEAEIRSDFSNAWQVETEHFLVSTNTSLEEGVEVARKLEAFHQWLTTNMAAFFDTPEALRRRFEEAQQRRRRSSSNRPMQVHYYATRDEYNVRLRGKVPANQTTNGVYWEPDLTSYFFRNPEDPDHRTVFHEATHQILDIATRQHRVAAARRLKVLTRSRTLEPWRLCGRSNFWVIEGLACYFESFEARDGVVHVGDPQYIRFVGAKQRLLIDGFYIPLQNFMALGQENFMRHPNVAQFYTQASGVVHFLMHYDNGRYRDDLVQLLNAVYRPDIRNLQKQPSFSEISGVSFDELDLQYRNHIENL